MELQELPVSGDFVSQMPDAFWCFSKAALRFATSDAISNAELILRRIDERWPTNKELK